MLREDLMSVIYIKMKQLRLKNKTSAKESLSAEPVSKNPYESAILAAELGGQVPTLDLHGFTVDEALHVLENFIFKRHPAGEALKVIHGRGNRILRDSIHKWLQNNPKHMACFRDSSQPGEQGGVTYVVMDL